MTTHVIHSGKAAFADALLPFAGEATQVPAKAKPGFFARLVAAIAASNQAKAEREIRRIEALYGRPLRERAAGRQSDNLPFLSFRE